MKNREINMHNFQLLCQDQQLLFSELKRKNQVYLLDWIDLFNRVTLALGNESGYIVDKDKPVLIYQGVIIVIPFFPTLIHKIAECNFEIHLLLDGKAVFSLPNNDDIRDYPDLYNFKGDWKISYNTLLKIVRKGWPYLCL
jgi:hypothetical protein